MEKKNLTVILIAGAVVFVVGVGIGFATSGIANKPRVATMQKLSSKLVVSMVMYGEIIKIDGRNIVLNYKGDETTLTIGNNAKIYSFISDPQSKGNKTVSFEDIKKGDKVNVAVSLSPEGVISVQSLIILPNPK